MFSYDCQSYWFNNIIMVAEAKVCFPVFYLQSLQIWEKMNIRKTFGTAQLLFTEGAFTADHYRLCKTRTQAYCASFPTWLYTKDGRSSYDVATH